MGILQSCYQSDERGSLTPSRTFTRLLPKTFSARKVAASPKVVDSRCVGKRGGCGALAMRRVRSWGAAVDPARADMDRFAVCSRERALDVDGNVLVVGVFDGHGVAGASNWGRDVADQACAIVVDAAFETTFDAVLSPGASLARLFERFQDRHDRRYDDTVGRDVREQWDAFEAAHGFAPPKLLPPEGGSTATVLRVEGSKLTVAWVGDSRAALARRDGGAEALTSDHNAENSESERDRVEAAGGTIAGAYVGVDGAEGLLQVTRSLGDRAHHVGGCLLATPDVRTVDLGDDAAFLVVASDGLWHVHDERSACAFVAAKLGALGDDAAPEAVAAAARDLAADAKRRAADSRDVSNDDVTVVVVVLQAP